MTIDERREFLLSRGFEVAAQPFAGSVGPLWYIREIGPAPSAPQRPYDDQARKYFIELVSGRWQRWGTLAWREWEAGPWHELVEAGEDPPRPSSVDPFVADCLAAGFTLPQQTIREHCIDGVDLGCRWLERDGQRYLAYPALRILIDCRFEKRRLDEFRQPEPKVFHRPFVSMRENPVTFSGARKQRGLF